MNSEELLVRVAINNWKAALEQIRGLLSGLSDEELELQVSPGRNRVYYIVGHLAAVHDRMFTLLGFGERLHPEFDNQFLKPDRTIPDGISGADLRGALDSINSRLTKEIESLPVLEWLGKHSAVSDADFAKDPLRNRLAILLSRTGHVMYHAGQIRLTK